MHFYLTKPTALASWRRAILLGANARTYKFALGDALLKAARDGRDALPLDELAIHYSSELVRRAALYPQGPATSVKGASDFLRVLEEEAPRTRASDRPTERLTAAAAKSMPAMVMQKFHNVPGADLEHRFYEIRGSSTARVVELTPAMRAVARHAEILVEELHARWSIVEVCFDAGIGRSLVRGGVVLAQDGTTLVGAQRRVAVTHARGALEGFQDGECFYCSGPLDQLATTPHVDHVFPVSLMWTGAWSGGPDLNGLWNLVVACSACNLDKSNRLPSADELHRLSVRNDGIAGSPHPLRRTLELSMRLPERAEARNAPQRRSFLLAVESFVRHGRILPS